MSKVTKCARATSTVKDRMWKAVAGRTGGLRKDSCLLQAPGRLQSCLGDSSTPKRSRQMLLVPWPEGPLELNSNTTKHTPPG